MFTTLMICSVVFAITVIWVASRERLALYHPLVIFCLWHFVGYLYVPWKIYLNQEWEHLLLYQVPINNDLFLVKTLLLVLAGFLFVILGYSNRLGVSWNERWRLPPIVILPRVALGLGLLTTAIAVYAILHYHSIPGVHHATGTFETKDALGRGLYTGATGYVVSAPDFLIGIGLIWYLVYRQEKTRFWQCLFWGMTLLYLFFSITKGWHRTAWVTFLFGLGTLFLLSQCRRWPTFGQSVRLLPLAVVFLLIFNISGTDRQAWLNVLEKGTPLQEYANPNIRDLSEFKIGYKRDISNFEYNVFQASVYPEVVGYEWGRGFIGAWFVAALPRVLFPDKDKYSLPTNMSRSTLVRFTIGPTTGLYLDFYRNFGIPGLIIGCFLFGAILRFLWHTIVRYEGTGKGYRYLMVVFSGFITFLPQLLRDGLSTMVSGYFFVMTPILLTIFLSWRNGLRFVPVSRRRKGHLAERPFTATSLSHKRDNFSPLT